MEPKQPREFVEAMRQQRSMATGKQYSMRLVLYVAGYSSSSWYGKRKKSPSLQRRGPKPALSDERVLLEIREEIAHCPFHSEGYKKVRSRLRRRGICVGKQRVLRLMRAHSLLAPVRPKRTGSSRAHDWTIITEMPNQLWGTDGKQFRAEEAGWHWFFGVISHWNDEIHSWYCAKRGNRFAALEPVRQAVKQTYGAIGQGVAEGTGIFLRSDHGTQYMLSCLLPYPIIFRFSMYRIPPCFLFHSSSIVWSMQWRSRYSSRAPFAGNLFASSGSGRTNVLIS